MKCISKTLLSLFLLTVFFIFSCTFSNDGKSGNDQVEEVNPFADTKGGLEGGKIIKVTNLNPSGEGSFLNAVQSKGPRIIVFEVAGVINLNMQRIDIREPYLTIAGQTAPYPGVTFIRGSITIKTHDVIVSHIKMRPGDAGQSKKSGWGPDGITTWTGEAYNIIIDHCSVTWAVDENISTTGKRLLGPENTSRRVTISNCIIAEGLSNSTHGSGEHSKGSLIHDNCRNIKVIKNLYAHNNDRNPYFKTAATGIIANNLIYNPGKSAIRTHWVHSEWEEYADPPLARIAIVGNVLIPGTDTRTKAFIHGDHAELYIEDNFICDEKKNITVTSGDFQQIRTSPFVLNEILNSDEVSDYVLSTAGACPAERDPVDKRIVKTVMEKTGRIIDSQEEVGGYPEFEPVYRELQVPENNIGDWLEDFSRKVEGR